MENATAGRFVPRLIAWELTRRCNLSCRHCRADADDHAYTDELSTAEAKALINEIARHYQPILIFTGGEPLMRADVFELAKYATKAGLRVVLATNGTTLDVLTARRLVGSGVRRISVSLDGKNAASHDALRDVPGCFEASLEGIRHAKTARLPFQINTTVTQRNFRELPEILALAEELGAAAFHLFLVVPTGRGRSLRAQELNAEEYERVLEWVVEQKQQTSLELKVTCAPMFERIARSQKTSNNQPGRGATRGCLGGIAFCFISHVGRISPCGYLDLDCGSVRSGGFVQAWRESAVFQNLRNTALLRGKCGRCEFTRVCGGCRARAYSQTGDYLAEEPKCLYQP